MRTKRGYQNYDIRRNLKLNNITFLTHTSKFSAINALFVRLHTEHPRRSGSPAWSTRRLQRRSHLNDRAWQAGYRSHDSEYVGVFNRVAAAIHATVGLHAFVYSFGSPMPVRAQIVFCGVILHWIFCLTSNSAFKGFGGILTHLLEYATKYLLIEWVDPSDRAVKGFGHIARCGIDGLENQYTVGNFERAVKKHATLESKQSLDGPSRVLYVIRVRQQTLSSPSAVGEAPTDAL